MSKIKMAVSFTAGFIFGGGLTFLCTKTYLERKKIEEINEYRATIVSASLKVKEKKEELKQHEDALDDVENTESGIKPKSIAKENNDTPDTGKEMFTQRDIEQYTDYAMQYDGSKKEPENLVTKNKHINGAYAIDPEDYGSIAGYDQIHFTYYLDDILVDDDGYIIDDYKIKDTIGTDFKDYFGEYSDDCAWFRNDDNHCDYEVEKSIEPYYGG